MSLESSAEALEGDLLRLHKALFQHRSWVILQQQAGSTLDRAGAALLKAIKHGDGKCQRPLDIANYLGVEAPTITRKVQQLEAEGLIERKNDPKDGRAFNLTVTSKGYAELKKLQKARLAQLEDAISAWSEEDKAAFSKLLRAFTDDIYKSQLKQEQE